MEDDRYDEGYDEGFEAGRADRQEEIDELKKKVSDLEMYVEN